MYPQVTQLETRKRLLMDELHLLQERQSRRRTGRPSSRTRVQARVGATFNGTAATLRRAFADLKA